MEPFDLREWPRFACSGGDLTQPAIIDEVAIHSEAVASKRSLFVALKGARVDGHAFLEAAAARGASFALVDREVATHKRPPPPSLTYLLVDDPLEALQEIARLYRDAINPVVVGITGSFGKTMCKDLLSALLCKERSLIASPESFNSQLGVALSLFRLRRGDEIALIEMGVSKQGEMERLVRTASPSHALVTSIGAAHLDSIGGLAAIAAEKGALVEGLPEGGWALLPSNEPLLKRVQGRSGRNLLADHPHQDLPHLTELVRSPKGVRYTITFPNALPLSGEFAHPFLHQYTLWNIALKAAYLLGATREMIGEALLSYRPEPMRCEVWTSPLGTTFVNDCYAADPLSIEKSLRLFAKLPRERRRVFVFGGLSSLSRGREGAMARLNAAIKEAAIDVLLLTEAAASMSMEPLRQELTRSAPKLEIHLCPTRAAVVERLRALQQRGTVVLIKGAARELLEAISGDLAEGIGRSRLTLHLDAVRHNLEALLRHTGEGAQAMPMLKASAYGTSSVGLAHTLAYFGHKIFGLAHLQEAIELRLAGVSADLFVLHAAKGELSQVVDWDLQVAVSDRTTLLDLATIALQRGKIVSVHLHIDTGMRRFGVRPSDALELAKEIAANPSLRLVGALSHLTSAEDPSQDSVTKGQIDLFLKTCHDLKEKGISLQLLHIANSAGAMRFAIPECNLIRPGLALFGLYPSSATTGSVELKAALSLTSHLAAIHDLSEGERVSYGGTYEVSATAERIGIVPLGYFDGIHKSFGNGAYLLVHGKRAPIVGAICMDYLMISLASIPEAEVGDTVHLFGQDEYGCTLRAEEFARLGSSTPHQLITCLGPRIQRLLVYEGESYDAIRL